MATWTPELRIKWLILEKLRAWGAELPEITAENCAAVYSNAEDGNEFYDAKNEVRTSGIETSLSAPVSRNYNSVAVAAQCPDGQWVGWTYWYGGGKHGEPSAMDWMDSAYDVLMREEQRIVQVFSRAQALG